MELKHPKICDLNQLVAQASQLKAKKKKIVLCHGHFNVIHPGHLRFLTYAKTRGDFVLISVMSTDELAVENKDLFFSQDERSLGVANLELVDAVIKSEKNILDIIQKIAPDIYLKGKEFEQQTALIENEIHAVEKNGGKVVFSSGDVEYSSAKMLLGTPNQKQEKKNYTSFLQSCLKHDVSLEKIKSKLQDFQKLKLVVIGDTIVDQFVACDPLGLSSEAPVVVVKELNSKEFIGGAAIISQHVRSLGASCTYISVVGMDEPANFVASSLKANDVQQFLIPDDSRPTTFKIRYIVGNQKILRVSRLSQHDLSKNIEDKFINQLEELLKTANGVIISDFVYGMITPRILEKIMELKKRYGFKVFGDTQCSSQFGDVSKFQNITLITPTEKEARIALSDQSSGLEKLARDLIAKTNNDHLVITLGENGILVYTKSLQNPNVYESDFFNALEENPADIAGAGDAMLTGYALGLCSDLNLYESSILATCMSAVSIMRIGNIPIQPYELIEYIDNLMRYQQSNLEGKSYL